MDSDILGDYFDELLSAIPKYESGEHVARKNSHADDGLLIVGIAESHFALNEKWVERLYPVEQAYQSKPQHGIEVAKVELNEQTIDLIDGHYLCNLQPHSHAAKYMAKLAVGAIALSFDSLYHYQGGALTMESVKWLNPPPSDRPWIVATVDKPGLSIPVFNPYLFYQLLCGSEHGR